jgi:ubiquinone/menaquinone biosynthesis C-methylase UbiE
MVHEVAAKGFGAQAAAYDRSRPSYPPDAIGWLADALRIRPGHRVVDLAAGTGKLTAPLARTGADLIAVEPVTAMRDVLLSRLPGVAAVAGVAESLPFASGSIDAVTVAQAFHWFDSARAMAELARVIRVGGRLGVIWNSREPGEDWVDQVWAVMDRMEFRAPWRSEGARGTAGAQPDRSEGWTERILPRAASWSSWTMATFAHVQRATHQDVVERMLSVSHIAALPPAEQKAVLTEIRTILSEHPDTKDQPIVSISYLATAWYAERVAAA